MSSGMWVSVIWLIILVCFGIGLMAYLFVGPGSSRWYR